MLDAQDRLIEYVELFQGTMSQASVYRREVVKKSLAFNAVAAIFCHNHPSGVAKPSRADDMLTSVLKTAQNRAGSMAGCQPVRARPDGRRRGWAEGRIAYGGHARAKAALFGAGLIA